MPAVSPPRGLPALLLIALLGLALPGCGGGGGSGPGPVNPAPTCAAGTGNPIVISGTIQYRRLALSIGTGLGPTMLTLPARFVDVEIRSAGGATCYARGSTDANGQYSIGLLAEPGASLEVFALSRTLADPTRDLFVHNTATVPSTLSHNGDDAHFYSSVPFPANGNTTADFTIPYNPGNPQTRPSIGFAILDVMIRCWDAVRGAGAGAMPGLHVYCRLGNNASVFNTSFYLGSSRSIAVLGGAAGNLDGSDTDYFDDPVLSHEFGHYVEDVLAHSMSRGGAHGGQLLEPAFAFSEGQATGFGQALIGRRFYIDTTGTSPSAPGFLDIESIGGNHVVGIGSEDTIAELVYDLADGGPSTTLGDNDGDGIGLTFAQLYGALFSMSPAADAPYIGLLLDRLVAAGALTVPQVQALLLGTAGDPHSQGISYPLAGGDIWPIGLAIPGNVSSAAPVDSLPGPNKVQQNGFTSTAWHRFTLGAAQTVTITLAITPVAGSGDDLDLFLYGNADTFNPIRFSTNGGASAEQIGPVLLQPGTYIVVVDAFAKQLANRANYTLSIN